MSVAYTPLMREPIAQPTPHVVTEQQFATLRRREVTAPRLRTIYSGDASDIGIERNHPFPQAITVSGSWWYYHRTRMVGDEVLAVEHRFQDFESYISLADR